MKKMSRRSFLSGSTFGAGLFLAQSSLKGEEKLLANVSQDAAVGTQLPEDFAWSMAIIPDPQSYSKFARNQPAMRLLNAWIVNHLKSEKIALTLCTGDLVEQNGIEAGDGVSGDQSSIQQWEFISDAMRMLDGKIPYVVVPGNHDYGIRSAENRESKLDQFFPVDGNARSMGTLIDCAPNAFGKKTLENAAYEFVAPGGVRYLILALEFAPRNEVLDWALEFARRPQYIDHVGIVLTHSYLDSNSKRVQWEGGYKIQTEGTNAGEGIWQKLVQPARNIRFVICGHIAAPDNFEKSVGYRYDMNAAGLPVHQILFDTQALGGGWNGNGGDGWIQLLHFSADGKTIGVKSISTLFDFSPTTRYLAEEKAPWARYVISRDQK